MKLLPVIFGVILVAIAFLGGFVGLSGEGTEELEVPSCSTGLIEGIDFCEKSAMLEQNIPVPEAVNGIIIASFSAQWDAPEAWLGIVDASDGELCMDSGDGYLLCDTEDLTFIVGGPDSEGEIDWTISGGNYRFVAGNTIDGSAAQTTLVNYEYKVILTQSLTYGMALFGVVFIAYGAVKN